MISELEVRRQLKKWPDGVYVFNWWKLVDLILEHSPSTVIVEVTYPELGTYMDRVYVNGEINTKLTLPYRGTYSWTVKFDGNSYDCTLPASEEEGWNHSTFWPRRAKEKLLAGL